MQDWKSFQCRYILHKDSVLCMIDLVPQILSLEINVLDDTMACRTSVWHNNTSIIGNQCMPVPHYSCTLYCILSRGLTSFILVMRKWFRCCHPFLIICQVAQLAKIHVLAKLTLKEIVYWVIMVRFHFCKSRQFWGCFLQD